MKSKSCFHLPWGTLSNCHGRGGIPEEARKDRGTQIALIKPRWRPGKLRLPTEMKEANAGVPPPYASFTVLAVCVKSPDFCLLAKARPMETRLMLMWLFQSK